ncbi:DNA/RNA helicase domain-containing protein [Kitasatospora sp. HPMI-4]|uniref:DNA/RNA helicase domain-containing protein n=1 Tax=Kitasatospora sp. HPMI-4 TaxID=3448443 RepID=UPI003F194656
MHLFGGTVAETAKEVTRPEFFARCEQRFLSAFGSPPSPQEVRSWRRSWPVLMDILLAAELGGLRILLEYALPATGERVDALLVGEGTDGVLDLVAVELKQWTRLKTVPQLPGLVRVGERVVQHPARQVGGYASYLEDWIAQDRIRMRVQGIAVLHDAPSDRIAELRRLSAGGPSERFPVLGHDDLATTRPPRDLARVLGCADVWPPSETNVQFLLESEHRPSPGLLARAGKVIEGHDAFRLIGAQDVARQDVLHAVAAAQRRRRTGSVVVVTGGPGTGKTVVACRLLGDLCGRQDTNLRLLSPSGTLTRQLKRTVGESSRGLIATFAGKLPNGLGADSVILVDEAHRARTGLAEQRTGFPIVLGKLIEKAAVTVLFLDERQIIRPTEGVTVNEVRQYASSRGLDFSLIELRTQFRCNGSQAYHHWIDKLLAPEGPAPVWQGSDYDLALADNPDQFTRWVDTHVAAGDTARVTAGFCWPWDSPSTPPLVPEVEIPWNGPQGPVNWARPWNFREDDAAFDAPDIPGRPFWATDPGGHNQVGCVYTAQGLEYTHNVVIIGDDLVRRGDRWVAQPRKSHDTQLNWLSPERYLPYALNTYRVLATRGTVATRLYSTDSLTQAYLQTLLPPHQLSAPSEDDVESLARD